MRVRAIIAAVFGVVLAATTVQAQGFPGGGMGGRFPGGGMGGRGGRGGIGRYRPPVEIPDLGNPVRRYILENRTDLKLTDAQTARVDSVARALDSQNDSMIAAVRRALGMDRDTAAARPRGDTTQDLPDTERGGAGRPDDIRLRDRLNALKPQIKQIRANDDAAWKSATALLEKDQRKQADKLKSDAEKEHDRARNRWRGPGSGGMGGPEDF